VKIAVIGSGVSGLGAAHALSDVHDVTIFEADARLGGHANTVSVKCDDSVIDVDTGFIVFNEVNYPNLTAMFAHLGVETVPSDMSFGFSMDGGAFEYACDSLDKIFAQRTNIFKPRFWLGVRETLRFMKRAPVALETGETHGVSLLDWLQAEGFSSDFQNQFILPMAGAIWSTPASQMGAFPATNFIQFFKNHDLFTGLAEAQQWRTVKGGSRQYVSKLAAHLGDRARTSAPVASVRRVGPMMAPLVEVTLQNGNVELFDQVVMACHAPTTRALMMDQDAEERATLAPFRTTKNRVVLHRDVALMPQRRKVWSSWSMLTEASTGDQPVTLSYWMNRLQSLPAAHDLFVTMNAQTPPDPALTIAEFDYEHPYFDKASFAAQSHVDAIQGRGGVWYAGAWLGWGFHEDGLKSGLRVAEALGARPKWAQDLGVPLPQQLPAAHLAIMAAE
jgi:predicted NAD/FAD-binding protein